MAKESPKEIFLKDYKAPNFAFETVNLNFELGEEHTIVTSSIHVLPKTSAAGGTTPDSAPLVLDGENLQLLSVKIDGEKVGDENITVSARQLTLTSTPSAPFDLEIVTKIEPQNNTSLEGLYKSSGTFCTQCEAEGFRKITYYQDRPDVMSKFTTRIEANRELYPVLLSNGNLVEKGELADGNKHYVVWKDPFRKPSYLFALVAGQLVSRNDTFTTCSRRQVALHIWTQAQDVPKTEHAMLSLKAAMKWDEEVFGLEYDLNLYNIVAVPDFNGGAMENKSLNIFNSKLVLASPQTATDGDFASIEGVIGHEYFHNWTGNRVTCRDWFQLSLKEGLTVFRDQEFSSDMGSRGVKRITDVSRLRISQFPQDAGPMAHPVRPDSYIKMDNFYTVTVYEKGAEVIRMYQTLLGKAGFRKGMDLYFKRHDGQAVTCEDFLAAMFDANQAKFPTFPLWYSQAGTPLLTVTTSYNAEAQTFRLKCRQEVPPTPRQPEKEPMLIPLAVGLLDSKGIDMHLSSVKEGTRLHSFSNPDGSPVTTTVLRVDKAEQEFIFLDIKEKPVASLLRNFSAPVRLDVPDVSDEDLFFLLAHDSDQFNRWEAGQALGRKLMLNLVARQQKGEKLSVDSAFIEGLRSIITDSSLDKEFVAKALALPGESEVADLMPVADPDAIHEVCRFIVKQIASSLRRELLEAVKTNHTAGPYNPTHKYRASRALKNSALTYLVSLNEPDLTELAITEYKTAANLTDKVGALVALSQNPGATRTEVLADFYDQYKGDNLVTNKWLALQAMSDIPGNVEQVRKLLEHPAFDIRNPNKVYTIAGGFSSSAVNFHAKDGSGYKFLVDIVLQLDKLNPQVAARIMSPFSRWRRFDEARQAAAKVQLERITSTNGLSDNVFEIASKCLTS
jgi:aminopeptidase N